MFLFRALAKNMPCTGQLFLVKKNYLTVSCRSETSVCEYSVMLLPLTEQVGESAYMLPIFANFCFKY